MRINRQRCAAYGRKALRALRGYHQAHASRGTRTDANGPGNPPLGECDGRGSAAHTVCLAAAPTSIERDGTYLNGI